MYCCRDASSPGALVIRNLPGVCLTTTPFTGGGDVNSEGGGDVNPAISPGGKTVTFIRQKEEGSLQALFAVDIDRTNERRIVPYRFDVLIKHDWSPNRRVYRHGR